jgi:hypothetical protein
MFGSRTLQSSPESGHRVDYDGARRRNDSKVHTAVDTPGQLLTPADKQDRACVGQTAALHEVTASHVGIASVNQGSTGNEPEQSA